MQIRKTLIAMLAVAIAIAFSPLPAAAGGYALRPGLRADDREPDLDGQGEG